MPDDGLPTFLLARIAEREKVARAAAARVRRWPKATRPPWVRARAFAQEVRQAALEAFEGRETPDEVLAECEAKRRIVRMCVQEINILELHKPDLPEDAVAAAETAWTVLRLLALPHADRDGYDPSWAPR